MPAFQTVLAELNRHFGKDNVSNLTARAQQFAPGNGLDLNFLIEERSPLQRAWKGYIERLPESMREVLRTLIHHALSTSPPTQITFAWAPGYDYELNIWQAPDTEMTRGGITVLVKTRYPDDKHPLSKG